MPAKFIRSYQYVAPDGAQFPTLEEEMEHELHVAGGVSPENAHFMVENREQIITILRQKERRHASPAAKTPRKRKDKPAADPKLL